MLCRKSASPYSRSCKTLSWACIPRRRWSIWYGMPTFRARRGWVALANQRTGCRSTPIARTTWPAFKAKQKKTKPARPASSTSAPPTGSLPPISSRWSAMPLSISTIISSRKQPSTGRAFTRLQPPPAARGPLHMVTALRHGALSPHQPCRLAFLSADRSCPARRAHPPLAGLALAGRAAGPGSRRLYRRYTGHNTAQRAAVVAVAVPGAWRIRDHHSQHAVPVVWPTPRIRSLHGWARIVVGDIFLLGLLRRA